MIRRVGWIAVFFVLSGISLWPQSPSAPDAGMPPAAKRSAPALSEPSGGLPVRSNDPVYSGNEVCAVCHAAIYQSYRSTPMARASGPAIDNVIPADFVHSKSGVHYRIESAADRVWLNFDRPNDSAVRGKRELLYYIGSGRRGLSYLFAQNGFLFESPINWYGRAQRWDMAPAYQNATEIPLNLPAVASCLRCHVSSMRPPVKGTENLYPKPPFLHAGVSCERCHGTGAAHIAGAAGAIVNPARLSPDRRDAICMQCHLEGKVAIERPGRHAYDFQPGESLFDYIRYYVLAGNQQAGLGGVSQVEALTQSMCKRKSGDAMSCTSCHDPHYEPPAEGRAAYYREKCLACHGTHFAAKHNPAQPECTHCHMPAVASTNVAHTEVTDHRIPRRPQGTSEFLAEVNSLPLSPRLVPFPDSAAAQQDLRDLALAWQSLANGGMEVAEPHAESLLRSAVASFPRDPDLLSALAYVEQKHGLTVQASDLYRRALAVDPDLIDAATDLGVIEMERGHVREAAELWQRAFQRAPGRSSLGMNLVVAFCYASHFDEARTAALRVLQFNPDMTAAKRVLQTLNRTPPACSP